MDYGGGGGDGSIIMDGVRYTYLRFTSETITRSGYQVRRKNLAVLACGNKRKEEVCYVLGTSARSDQYNEQKEKLFLSIIESFRLR